MSGPNVVQRHPTIPMTKRDSLSTNASRLSLISTNSNASNSKHLNDNDQSVQKRTRKAQRTESYKRATQGLSVFEDLCAQNGPREIRINSRTTEERRKYNTLPVGKENNNNIVDVSNSNHRTQKEKHSQFVERNTSVKSGTYPSPDTDDSPYSVEPERKKKSGFKRFKERLVLTFRKDARERKRRLEKENSSDSQTGKRGHKPISKGDKHGGNKNKPHKNGTHSNHQHSHDIQEKNVIQDSPVKIRKELSIFQSFRESFRRKSPPEYRREGSKESLKRNSNDAQITHLQSSATSNSKGSYRQKVVNKQANGPIERIGDYQTGSSQYSANSQSNRHHLDNKGASIQRHDQSSASVRDKYEGNRPDYDNEDVEDFLEESVDLTTDIFGAIIDPSSRPHYFRQHSSVRQQPPRPPVREISNIPRGADRSQLTLEGLRKNRPKSFDKTPGKEVPDICYSRPSIHAHRDRSAVVDHRGRFHVHDLSPNVEVDGPDYADGAVSEDDELTGTGLSDAFIDADDHKDAVHNVARCLKIVADKIVEEKRRTVTEDEIVKALREIADEIDRDRFQGKNVPFGIPRELIPAMTNIIKAKTYASFVDVIKQETAKTIGWEQVAWYTLLTKSALQLPGLGQNVGRRVKSMAMRYFNSKLRPFVDSRPKGWESIHEDTDIESELD